MIIQLAKNKRRIVAHIGKEGRKYWIAFGTPAQGTVIRWSCQNLEHAQSKIREYTHNNNLTFKEIK